MKKLLALALILALALPLAALAAETYEIAMVTDVGNIDDQSFNQSAWEGVKEYAEANNKTFAYYRPSEDSDDARVESIRTAVEKGAKNIVLPGWMFAKSAGIAQTEFPDVNFILIDADPEGDKDGANTYSIYFQEEQAGYLAGYAVVKDGYKKLGFLGGVNVPAVIRFGFGFVQGADAAAKEMNLTDVEIKYWYCGSFGPSDDIKTRMAGWFTEGTEIVFACGGGIYLSADAAAKEANGKIIGVDIDQYFVSERVVTSAFKDLKASVKLALTKIYENGGKLPADMGGKSVVLGVKDGTVGIPTAEHSWRFKTFKMEDYQKIYEDLKSGKVVVANAVDKEPVVTNVKVDYQK